jgi:hypothetical protein
MARIRFLKPIWSSVVGSVETDDLLDVSDHMADHFVNVAGVAEFATVQMKQEPDPAAEPKPEKPAPAKAAAAKGKK